MARSGPSSGEVDRLRQVYEGYDRDDDARRRWSTANPGNRAIHAERARRVDALLDRLASGSSPRLLDLGCGAGQALSELGDRNRSRAIGLDLNADRLRSARNRLPAVSFVVGEGSALPFPDAAFGAVLAFTVFSSVRDLGLRAAIAAEIDRVLRPGGAVVWYDMRRPSPGNREVGPIDRRGVSRLFPTWRVDVRPATVLPPLARHLGRFAGTLYGPLARVPVLNTHLLGIVIKPG